VKQNPQRGPHPTALAAVRRESLGGPRNEFQTLLTLVPAHSDILTGQLGAVTRVMGMSQFSGSPHEFATWVRQVVAVPDGVWSLRKFLEAVTKLGELSPAIVDGVVPPDGQGRTCLPAAGDGLANLVTLLTLCSEHADLLRVVVGGVSEADRRVVLAPALHEPDALRALLNVCRHYAGPLKAVLDGLSGFERRVFLLAALHEHVAFEAVLREVDRQPAAFALLKEVLKGPPGAGRSGNRLLNVLRDQLPLPASIPLTTSGAVTPSRGGTTSFGQLLDVIAPHCGGGVYRGDSEYNRPVHDAVKAFSKICALPRGSSREQGPSKAVRVLGEVSDLAKRQALERIHAALVTAMGAAERESQKQAKEDKKKSEKRVREQVKWEKKANEEEKARLAAYPCSSKTDSPGAPTGKPVSLVDPTRRPPRDRGERRTIEDILRRRQWREQRAGGEQEPLVRPAPAPVTSSDALPGSSAVPLPRNQRSDKQMSDSSLPTGPHTVGRTTSGTTISTIPKIGISPPTDPTPSTLDLASPSPAGSSTTQLSVPAMSHGVRPHTESVTGREGFLQRQPRQFFVKGGDGAPVPLAEQP
jgi:hypothetical protein